MHFTDKEIEDIVEALRLASIHTPAPGESERWRILSGNIRAIQQLNHALKS